MGVSENVLMQLEQDRLVVMNEAVLANEKDYEINAKLAKQDLNSLKYKFFIT